ncbi:hypothetical protein QFC20_001875 [Naganishia adeliensis]|uniref:Uncharacterized protein n=1 Tax=Naganishia adeliensis TaxID=92952 RepID=A0ACC2WQN8_9TREE|nr:hypothetical protein QFC20_001875 [Naganishia adeliensis]
MSFVTAAGLWKAGASLTAVGITTSAFGAHYLKGKFPQLTPQSVQNWSTAGSYLIYNGIALLAISQHPRFGRHKYAGPLIITGTTLFSFSIFGLVLARERWGKILGPTTPIGGTLMIAGYIALLL